VAHRDSLNRLFGRVAEWQTRWLQVPVSFGTWGFKSPFAHRNSCRSQHKFIGPQTPVKTPVPRLFAVPSRVFTAWYSGRCGLCGQRFPRGERICYIAEKTVAHEACAVPSGPVDPVTDPVLGAEEQAVRRGPGKEINVVAGGDGVGCRAPAVLVAWSRPISLTPRQRRWKPEQSARAGARRGRLIAPTSITTSGSQRELQSATKSTEI
jgi:hypothetical protein